MNTWEKDAFRSPKRAELGVDTKHKGPPTSTIFKKRTRADAPSNSDHLKATVGEHCQGAHDTAAQPRDSSQQDSEYEQ